MDYKKKKKKKKKEKIPKNNCLLLDKNCFRSFSDPSTELNYNVLARISIEYNLKKKYVCRLEKKKKETQVYIFFICRMGVINY